MRRAFNDQFWALVSARAGAVVDGAMAHGYKRLRLDSLDRCAPDEAPSRSTDAPRITFRVDSSMASAYGGRLPPLLFIEGTPAARMSDVAE